MPELEQEFRDKTSPVWDMSQERALLEQMITQRSSFFLIFISIVIASAVNAKSQIQFQIALGAGALFSWLVALAVIRTWERHDVVLQHILNDKTHPYSIVSATIGSSMSWRKIYRYLFWAICLLLTAFAAAAIVDLISVAPAR